jgi:TRAP-type C4-dicarboxylate transport system substrate-binding protein
MKRKNLAIVKPFVLFLSLMVIGMLSLSQLTFAKTYRLKIQSGYPRGDLSMDTLSAFAKSAEKRSDGQIKIQVFADNELVPVEQLFEAAKKGTLDMIHAMGAYWGGILSVGELEFGLPYMYNLSGKNYDESAKTVRNFFYEFGFMDFLRKEYGKQGLFYLDMHHYGPTFTMATSCITTLDEFAGKKIRVEGAWHDYYNMVGARGTQLTGTEAYMGLKLGTIDASQWDVSAVTGMKWHEVAPYRIFGGQNDIQPGHILFNQKKWKSLPDDIQFALKGAARDYYYALHEMYRGEMEKYNSLVKAGKITECTFDKKADAAHRKAAYKIMDSVAERDAAAAMAIKLVKEWRETLD